MVGKENLMNAIALNSSIVNSGRIVGPAIAGVLVATIGEGYCFLVNGLSFLAIIAGLLMMCLPPSIQRSDTTSAVERFLVGWRYISGHAPVRHLLLLLGTVTRMNFPMIVLMPVFADRVLGGGPKTLGLLMSAIGAGAILGSLYIASRTSYYGLITRIAFATPVYALVVILFSFSRNLIISCLLLAPIGFCLLLQYAGINTSVQTLVPDALHGRVMGFYALMSMGTTPFGSLLGGWLADWIGAQRTVALGGLMCLIAAYLFWRPRAVVNDALVLVLKEREQQGSMPFALEGPAGLASEAVSH